LTDGDALAHLLLGQPLPLADHLAFHLADERDGAAEAEEAEAQIVPDKLAMGTRRGVCSRSIGDPPRRSREV